LTFEGRFECGFDEVVKGKIAAVVAVRSKDGIGLGIAIANERGYCPIPLTWAHGDNFQEMMDHADEINREVLGISRDQAFEIIATTMRGRS
jgi:hypothetical protein